tara:strand:+ start:8739 stop:8993 length:255 start_codon:yes stop_codon:yes gene_type:complete
MKYIIIDEVNKEGFNPKNKLFAVKDDERRELKTGTAHEKLAAMAEGYEIIESTWIEEFTKMRDRHFQNIANDTLVPKNIFRGTS